MAGRIREEGGVLFDAATDTGGRNLFVHILVEACSMVMYISHLMQCR